jgi:hypothetical protein
MVHDGNVVHAVDVVVGDQLFISNFNQREGNFLHVVSHCFPIYLKIESELIFTIVISTA